MRVTDILERLENVRKTGANNWQASCPCHMDSNPSMTITETPDRILIYCHAGCETKDIVASLGLKFSDLYTNELPEKTWQKGLENYKSKQIEDYYNYTDENGNYLYTKVRFTDKDMIFGVVNKEGTYFKIGIKGIERTLYNLPAVIRAVGEGRTVYYVEGEKDVKTLKELKYTATTAGSVSDWKEEFSRYFKGARVVILPDNDEAGEKLTREILKDIKHYALAKKIVKTSDEPKGDVTDYIKKEGHTFEELGGLIDEAPWLYAPWIYENKGKLYINEGILAQSIEKTLDYIIVRNPVTQTEDMYLYKNGVYIKSGKNEVKAEIKNYLSPNITKDRLLTSVYNILMSSNTKIKTPEELNREEYLTSVKNGVVDVLEPKLLPHTPERLRTRQYNCSYGSKIYPENFIRYIRDLCTHDGFVDTEQIAVLQEWTGLILSNVNGYRVKKCLCLYSPLGNTGKSILLRVYNDVLKSDLVINAPIQKLSAQFAMAGVYGKRLIAVGDQSGKDIEDSSNFKQLTGGDSIRVEFKGKTEFNFLFDGCIVLVCNDLPSFKDDKGGHVFERLEIMECKNVIPPDKRDPKLYDKISKEFDGIYMWGLEGLQRLIKNNFRFTHSRENAETLNMYRGRLDTLFGFINEHCEITGDYRNDRIKKTDFHNSYFNWCALNGVIPLESKNIPERGKKNGIITGVYHGFDCYKGIRYKEGSSYYKTEQLEFR